MHLATQMPNKVYKATTRSAQGLCSAGSAQGLRNVCTGSAQSAQAPDKLCAETVEGLLVCQGSSFCAKVGSLLAVLTL